MTLLRLSIIIKLLTITDMHRCIHAHLPRKTFTHMHSNKQSRHLGNGLWVFIWSPNCWGGLVLCSRAMCSVHTQGTEGANTTTYAVKSLRIKPTISSSGRAVKCPSVTSNICILLGTSGIRIATAEIQPRLEGAQVQLIAPGRLMWFIWMSWQRN